MNVSKKKKKHNIIKVARYSKKYLFQNSEDSDIIPFKCVTSITKLKDDIVFPYMSIRKWVIKKAPIKN